MSLITELKRRNVIRVGLLYLVSGWLILQVADVLAGLFGLPDWSMRFVGFILLLGFPLVLIFSWAYELTPEGLKRERDIDRSESITRVTGRRLDVITIVVVVLGVAIVLVRTMGGTAQTPVVSDRSAAETKSPPAASDRRKSIAVLPFDNFSEDPGNAFFASGVHEDILTHLAKIDDLKVISRTSVAQYADSRPSVAQIAAVLGVGSIVEGSVRRAGNRIRVTAQLIDASTDEHLWAESFDRDLTDVFAIQTEIAQKIASALEATLTEEEEALIAQRPTDDMSAYDLYLRARETMSRPGLAREKFLEAESLVQQAISLDPDFALAYALLEKVQGSMVWFYDRSQSRKRATREAAEKAVELNPELPEARAALADYFYRVERNFERAIEELEAAHDKAPGNTEVLYDMGVTYRRLGRWEESLHSLRQAVELDPANLGHIQTLAQTLWLTQQWEDALGVLNPILQEHPENRELAAQKAVVLMDGFGDVAGALDAFRPSLNADSLQQAYVGLMVLTNAREWDALMEAAEDATTRFSLRSLGLEGFLEYFAGLAHQAQGNDAQSAEHFEAATALAQQQYEQEDSASAMIVVAQSLANLGRTDEAMTAIERVLATANDAIDRPAYRTIRAYVLAKAGNTGEALDELEELVTVPNGPSRWRLRLDPQWDFLRDNERFRELTEVEPTIR